LVVETLEDEWYVAVNAYKFTLFEILRDSFCFLFYHILRLHTIPIDSTLH